MKSLTDEERASLAKNRIKQIHSIRKGDYFALKNNPDQALTYYLEAFERLSEDVVVAKKIGHIYFQKKDWANAYAYYIKAPIGELNAKEKSEMFSALFFDESELDRMGEISRIPTEQSEKDYYKHVDICYTGIHNCILAIEAYSGTSIEIKGLQDTIINSEKISPDFHFRNFAVAAKFYEYGAYRASEKFAREILQNRPDYYEVLKLQGFSEYELGRYSQAKERLLAYSEKYPDDLQTVVKLSDIAFAMGNYAESNLYINNAIFAGYTPKTDLERKLAYNYSRLWDTVSMMKVLGYLLQEDDATEDDAAVAISLALEEGENMKAYVWAENAFKKYPDSSIVAGLYLTTLRLIGKTIEAKNTLTTLTQDIKESPIVLLEQGILALEDGDMTLARSFFEQVTEKDENADFSEEAKNYLDFIENTQKTDTASGSEEKWWWF